MAGRKPKISPEVTKRICDLIKAGNYDYVAASSCGIGKSTFYRWLERGEKAQRGIYREFRDAVAQAHDEAEIMLVNLIRKSAVENSADAKWLLERRAAERWAGRSYQGTLGKDGKPIEPEQTSRVLVVPAHVEDIHEWSKGAKAAMEKTQAAPDDERTSADVPQ